MTVDPTGYSGPLNYLEIMLNGKHRRGSGLWAEANDLRRMVYDAAFTTKKPFTDSHGQLAHYARSFELFDKEDAERKAELFERIDTIPHLADFHVDIDFEGDLEASQREAIKLVDHYLSLGVSEPAIGIRFSGKKGFDICLPWQVLGVRPQGVMALNWTTYKLLGEALIAKLDLKGVDTGLWRKNGTIRLENTQHPSGLFKVRVTPEELRDLDTVRQIAQEPRRSLYSAEAYQESLVVAPGLRSLYLPLQARADAALLQTKALRHRTLDPEVLKELSTGMVACLKNIAASPPQRGSRNEVVFHAAMMLKHTGHEAEAATHYAREWLGPAATEVGADETVRSVYQGPYSGGCRWMREMGFASEAECRACPVGKHRYTRDARVIEAPPLLLPTAEAPTLEMQRRQLEKDFDNLNPDVVNIIRTPAGLGKAQPLDALVMTPIGPKRMGDIRVGDAVSHPDGTHSAVVAVHPQGRVPIYRVSFSDGTSTECCGDHLWLTSDERERERSQWGRKGSIASVRTTQEVSETLVGSGGRKNHSIPMSKAVSMVRQPSLPIDPYLLGYLLGDGSLTGNSIHFTCIDYTDILPRLEAVAPDGVRLVAHANGQSYAFSSPPGQPNPLTDAMRELGLMGCGSYEKFIPRQYLYADTDQRLALLRGLMDTDGYISKSGVTVQFTSVSPDLADGVAFLVQSLGGIARRSSKIPTYRYKGEKKQGQRAYTINVSMPPGTVPFLSPKRLERFRPKSKYPPRRYIAGVEYVGEKEAQCITVSAQDGLYLTNDFIVTHNSYTALQSTAKRVQDGERVLFFVKDTLKQDGLAADLIDELREKHDYHGKIQILKGRNEENCEDWTNAERIAKKGYSVGRTLCTTCPARSYCDYYGQYDRAYEPGVYIAPHAMLPIIFADERRGFSSEYIIHTDQETGVTQRIGGKLSLIVIDEDALDVMIDRFFVGKYHLINELKHKQRRYKVYDKLAGRNVTRTRNLDKNWLRVVEWLLRGIEVKGPVMPTLASIARADGSDIRAALLAIDPAGIIDPDYRHNKGHKPFTERLYQALVAESPRLKDGNYTIWNTGGGMEVMGLAPVSFPSGIPVVVLDAYADQDLYERYYRAAGVNRMVKVKEYPVREHANVTYVLGANLLSRDIERYEQGIAPNVTKVNRIMKALRRLTEDGVETYVVAKRSFFASQVWKDWEPELPNCVAEGEAGQLYFWRGRGINAASGKRIAVLQVPNFHPDSVIAEASVLFADEPRLDDSRVRAEAEVVWAPGAKGKAYQVDKVLYADERLNLINERYRMDELVQMALRSRSLTTGAEIIVFADLPDERLPASRVFTVAELADDPEADAQEARQVIYEVLREWESLDMESIISLGLVAGEAGGGSLRSSMKGTAPEAYRLARAHPVERSVIEAELVPVQG